MFELLSNLQRLALQSVCDTKIRIWALGIHMWNKTKKKRKRKSCWNYYLHLLSLLHGLIVISHWSIAQELAIVVFVFGCCIISMYGFPGLLSATVVCFDFAEVSKVCMRALFWLHIFFLCLLMKWSWTNRQVNSTLQPRVLAQVLFIHSISLSMLSFVLLFYMGLSNVLGLTN